MKRLLKSGNNLSDIFFFVRRRPLFGIMLLVLFYISVLMVISFGHCQTKEGLVASFCCYTGSVAC